MAVFLALFTFLPQPSQICIICFIAIILVAKCFT